LGLARRIQGAVSAGSWKTATDDPRAWATVFDVEGELLSDIVLFDVVLPGTAGGEECSAVDPHPASINTPIAVADSRFRRVPVAPVARVDVARRHRNMEVTG
jgi:hypothetical protein